MSLFLTQLAIRSAGASGLNFLAISVYEKYSSVVLLESKTISFPSTVIVFFAIIHRFYSKKIFKCVFITYHIMSKFPTYSISEPVQKLHKLFFP